MRAIAVRLVLGLVLASTLALGLTGCGGAKDFSPEDFKKVEPGMTEDKVKELLGKQFDSAEASGVKWVWWKVGDKYYRAIFKDGKVTEAAGPSDVKEYQMGKALMSMPMPK